MTPKTGSIFPIRDFVLPSQAGNTLRWEAFRHNCGGKNPGRLRRLTNEEQRMSTAYSDQTTAQEPPKGHVRIVYLGPVAPHWEVESEFGDRAIIEPFRERVLARLVLLPPHDPQFRRNRERVVRDAERENLLLEWDLGVPEESLAG